MAIWDRITWKPTKWIDDLIEERMHAAGRAMVAVAETLVPVDTGLLKGSIYYTYAPETKTLTLHADTGYALFVEYGTYKMSPRPYLRPAIAAAGIGFFAGKLGGVSTQIMGGTYNRTYHKPLSIKPNIRASISAANKLHNVGRVSKTRLTAIHMNRSNQALRTKVGLQQKNRVTLSSLSKLNKIRGAWN